jgi:hypothetical protein
MKTLFPVETYVGKLLVDGFKKLFHKKKVAAPGEAAGVTEAGHGTPLQDIKKQQEELRSAIRYGDDKIVVEKKTYYRIPMTDLQSLIS